MRYRLFPRTRHSGLTCRYLWFSVPIWRTLRRNPSDSFTSAISPLPEMTGTGAAATVSGFPRLCTSCRSLITGIDVHSVSLRIHPTPILFCNLPVYGRRRCLIPASVPSLAKQRLDVKRCTISDGDTATSCKSPDSGYPATDTCGHGSACRSPHFGGT